MPELPGQRISGRPISELECYAEALHHINGLKTCLRGLAVCRMDTRWLTPVRLLDQMEDAVKRLMTKGGARVTFLPDRLT